MVVVYGMWLVCRCWHVGHARLCWTAGVGVGGGLQQALPSQKIQDGPSQPPKKYLYQDSSVSWSFVWQNQQNHHCWNWTNRWYMETPEKMETNVRAGHGVTMLPWLILLERFFPKHCAVDALRPEKKGMDEPVTDCTWNMNISNSQCLFSTRRSKLTHSARETQTFELESHASQTKWTSMLQIFLNKSHKYQFLVS